ncbi:hypothetical protein [Mycobacterium sp. SMC-2]|uniref:hypothetical protein n=1 Tax=Mycobacterium sp. SMC-2 TaxID=2857058 RepID=UPI0021B1C088|nr:hypothetical protein [Mycobacterium sp. SMC-2]
MYADAFVPRYRVTCALVIPKDRDGRLHHRYKGELLDYLNDEQRERFLRMGLVEEINDNQVPLTQTAPAPTDVPGPNTDLVDECIAALDRLGVAPDAGAPTCRTALRDRGQSWGNDTIAAAVRERKARAAGTAS